MCESPCAHGRQSARGHVGAARAPGGVCSAVGPASTPSVQPALPSLSAAPAPGRHSSFSEQLERPHELRSPSVSRSVWGTSVHRGPLISPAPVSTELCHFLTEGLPSSQRRMQRLGLGGRREGRKAGFRQGVSVCMTVRPSLPPLPSLHKKETLKL